MGRYKRNSAGGCSNTIGHTEKMNRNPWYDEECKKLNEEQSKAKVLSYGNPTPENIGSCRKINRETTKVCRRKKASRVE